MRWRDVDKPPLGGGLNQNHFVSRTAGQVALLRSGHIDRSEPMDVLHTYYGGVGFTTRDGGRVALRTAREQHDFMAQAALLGLAVLPPLTLEGNSLILPFLNGAQTLDEYLKREKGDPYALLPAIYADARNAHRHGFIYGDRSRFNILVQGHDFVHIDFDVAISGPTAREYEIAELSTHFHLSGGESVASTIPTILGRMSAESPSWINLDKTTTYLRDLGDLLLENEIFDAATATRQHAMATATYAVRDCMLAR